MSPNLSTNHSSSPLSMIAQPTPTGISASTNRFKSPKMFRKGVSREEKEKDREKHRERETQREGDTERETETERQRYSCHPHSCFNKLLLSRVLYAILVTL